MQLYHLVWNYWRARNRKFTNREELETYQQKKIAQFSKKVLKNSPYFSSYLSMPFADWPLMNKKIMMENLDSMNTAGLKLDDIWKCAIKAENSRDFSPMIEKYSVGLSSGTSDTRGVFVVSPKERAMWAGTILAKLLPKGLFQGEKIALFLRANNNLYQTINNRWISFRFFDLFSTFEDNLLLLNQYKPSIIVAPAQVLREIALSYKDGKLNFTPSTVISAAEVLEPLTKKLLEETFAKVDEVYQATEGFLGVTCSQGILHLNEDVIYVEKEWVDKERFVPIITDFTRETQPIVRYRLDDILVSSPSCPCGSIYTPITRIEGRCDDVLILPGLQEKEVTIFADLTSRIMAQILPLVSDYQLIQNKYTLRLNVTGDYSLLETCKNRLIQVFKEHKVDTDQLIWLLSNEKIPVTMTIKKRHIIRER